MARLGGGPSEWTYIVDGDDTFRVRCRKQLSLLGFSIRDFDSGAAFLDALPLLPAGCVLVDNNLPDMAGTALISRLGEMGVQCPAALMSERSDLAIAVAAIQAGAADLLEKPFSDDALFESVRTLLGQLESAPDQAEAIAMTDGRLAKLTPREVNVLDGIVAGLPNKKIALRLGISPRTVETYRLRIKHKMQAHSLPHLIKLAVAARSSAPTPHASAQLELRAEHRLPCEGRMAAPDALPT